MTSSNVNSTIHSEDLTPHIEWLQHFEVTHGRPLRVLHVGNIANNGYLNAKFLRRYGVEADVVSRDYYHVMATPEWEDLEIQFDYGDDDSPRFDGRDLGAYVRPHWFVSGPLALCPRMLKQRGKHAQPRRLRYGFDRVWSCAAALLGKRICLAFTLLTMAPRSFVLIAARRVLPILRVNRLLKLVFRSLKGLSATSADRILIRVKHFRSWHNSPEVAKAIRLFDLYFPARLDRLTASEVEYYLTATPLFRKMFADYDIIQCYATEPLHAFLADTKPYIAFEHGTLRDFTTTDNSISRMTSLGYRHARHTFVTNGDCLEYAKKIGLTRFSPIAHPIDVEQHRANFGEDIARIRSDLDADVILFCPIRHDYKVKGTDVHLQALPIIKAALKRSVRLVLIGWGQQVDESRRMLSKMDCGEDVVWKSPMSRITMIKYIRAADVVLDQMALPHFGSTAPQCLAAGVPVISSYDPKSTSWMFAEPAPILRAFSPEEVAQSVVRALDKKWRAGYENSARAWIDRFHSPDKIVTEHLSVYREALDNVG